MEKRLSWVFYKYDIRVKRYPKYGEKIKVVTMAKSLRSFMHQEVMKYMMKIMKK